MKMMLEIDKLWEKYYGWTPYQYSMNNPISLLDGNGKEPLLPMSTYLSQEQIKSNEKFWQSPTPWAIIGIAGGIASGGLGLEAIIAGGTLSQQLIGSYFMIDGI